MLVTLDCWILGIFEYFFAHSQKVNIVCSSNFFTTQGGDKAFLVRQRWGTGERSVTLIRTQRYPREKRVLFKVNPWGLQSDLCPQHSGLENYLWATYANVTYSCNVLIIYTFHTKFRIFNPDRRNLMEIVSVQKMVQLLDFNIIYNNILSREKYLSCSEDNPSARCH